ncbi:hypothetical protein Poli38472_007324 [Pythium oligandrum]|uniref:FYVE-type domain-containing protein n=1 Tax=Pythium oligandrum TaxID=41045 RepID=A0A8K1C9Y6_PYTOL|nr:hypothetical protein Poli38472_007324 [Pythium oligandrum]|eukprot:TMW59179.1 hypothetical protein Poli38472_007324 [Pythium oligandrum]
MKFPLSERPFAPLRLYPDQCREYKALVQNLLLETLQEYQGFVQHQHRQLSKTHWKEIKHRESLYVYRERVDPKDDVAMAAREAYSWSLPKLLTIGSMVGSLDDVMYGLVTPDNNAAKIRTSYMQDELLDQEILFAIEGPQSEDPFRFLGLKWSVRSYATALNPMASPRDSVYIEATGLHTLINGETVGYQVTSSVDIPQCGELKPLGIVRTRIASCSLFKQLGNGTVDVYMMSLVEPSGQLLDSSTLANSANSMLNCWTSVWCAQNKKLAWLAADAAEKWVQRGGGPERLVVTVDKDGNHCCGLCQKLYKMYHSVVTCQVCNLMVCSRCQIGRKISKVDKASEEVRQNPLVFCKNCIARSTKESARKIAQKEYTRERRGFVPLPDEPSEYSAPKPSPKPSREDVFLLTTRSSKKLRQRGHSIDTNSTTGSSLTDMGSLGPVRGLSLAESPEEEEEITTLAIQTVNEWDREHDSSFYLNSASSYASSYESAYTPRNASPPMDQQQQLWMQMNQLCLAAEQAYQITKQNANAMQGMSSFDR